MANEPYALTIGEAGRALRDGRLTSVALTESVLASDCGAAAEAERLSVRD